MVVFRNDGKGGFTPLAAPPLTQPVTRDQTTSWAGGKPVEKLFCWPDLQIMKMAWPWAVVSGR